MSSRIIFILKAMFFFAQLSFSQVAQINCYHKLNDIDHLLAVKKDTLKAIELFEQVRLTDCVIKNGRYRNLSRIYHDFGKTRTAKKLMMKSIESGMLGIYHFRGSNEKFKQELTDRFGKSFTRRLFKKHEQLSSNLFKKNQELISTLNDVFEKDQNVRQNKKNRDCKTYYFNYQLDQSHDTTRNHEEMMACARAYRFQDSIILKKFVDIVDSLGFVPGDDMIFGTVDLTILVNHTGQYEFKGLDELYLKSVQLGTLSPEAYAWYKGYYQDFFHKEHLYYFTHGSSYFEKLTKDQIEIINQRRKKIGLPPCPAVVWNTKVF